MYKVGDKVRIKNDLQEGSWYGSDTVADKMLKFLGKEVTISAISNVYFDRYRIEEDGGTWSWTEKMFFDKNITDHSPFQCWENKYKGESHAL